jgi:DASH complex subunit Duo1
LGVFIDSQAIAAFHSTSIKMSTPDVGKLDLSDSDTEDLFASPSKVSKQSQKPNSKSDAPLNRNVESKYDAEQAREGSLRKELESVRSINEVIEGVVCSLEVARGNMDVSITNDSIAAGPEAECPRRYRAQSHLPPPF